MFVSLSSLFNYAFIVGSTIVIQIATGLLLFTYYDCDLLTAYDSIQFLFRNVSFMWLSRLLHINLVCFIFLFVYCHVFKAVLLYSSKILA